MDTYRQSVRRAGLRAGAPRRWPRLALLCALLGGSLLPAAGCAQLASSFDAAFSAKAWKQGLAEPYTHKAVPNKYSARLAARAAGYRRGEPVPVWHVDQ